MERLRRWHAAVALAFFAAGAATGFGLRLSWAAILVGCGAAPFADGVLFRGYVFRQLYRRARWPFWAAALTPSALFALLHVYQAVDLLELLGILAVTGIGSVLLCWVFVRRQDNLWAPFAIHALMNLWWELFAVDDTALGGWTANGARLATVALGVLPPAPRTASGRAYRRRTPTWSWCAVRTRTSGTRRHPHRGRAAEGLSSRCSPHASRRTGGLQVEERAQSPDARPRLLLGHGRPLGLGASSGSGGTPKAEDADQPVVDLAQLGRRQSAGPRGEKGAVHGQDL